LVAARTRAIAAPIRRGLDGVGVMPRPRSR
jgi:hypothetical protein